MNFTRDYKPSAKKYPNKMFSTIYNEPKFDQISASIFKKSCEDIMTGKLLYINGKHKVFPLIMKNNT